MPLCRVHIPQHVPNLFSLSFRSHEFNPYFELSNAHSILRHRPSNAAVNDFVVGRTPFESGKAY